MPSSASAARENPRPSNEVRVQFIDTFYDFLHDDPKRVMVLYGGAGSGKSYSVAQYMVELLSEHRDLVLVAARKTRPALKHSSWQLLKDMLRKWQIPVEENKTDLTLTCKATGSVIYGIGLDDPEKVKSFDMNLVWLEEATEFTKADFTQLNLRCRRPGAIPNQLLLTFNPIDAHHWAVANLVQGRDPTVGVNHSTYMDSERFLPPSYVKELLDLETKDANFHRIYTLGEPGVLENVIYSNYRVLPFDTFPPGVRERQPDVLGLDFGFNDPMALVGVWRQDGVPYLHEYLYRSGMTNRQLIEWMNAEGISRETRIYADSSRPDQIAELVEAGYDCVACMKGPGSIKSGIDHLKSLQLNISSESVNMLKEIRAYSYKTTKDGRVMEEPVDYLQHSLDACRYAIVDSRPPLNASDDVSLADAVAPSGIPAFLRRR